VPTFEDQPDLQLPVGAELRTDDGPPDHWWRTALEPWWRDFDELGHMTAAAYPAAFEEAVGRFIVERWNRADPAYVVAHTTIDYLHEVRHDGLPLLLSLRPSHVGSSSFVLELALTDSSERLCATASTRYVAWDGNARGPRPLTGDERAALLG